MKQSARFGVSRLPSCCASKLVFPLSVEFTATLLGTPVRGGQQQLRYTVLFYFYPMTVR